MGDPKKSRRKYATPTKPWDKARIDEEKVIFKQYGLKNKKEIWRLSSLLRKYKRIAKQSIVTSTGQSEKMKRDVYTKLKAYGFVGESMQLDEVLSLTSKDFFERRLQTIVFKKNMANSVNQARQFIVHGHIAIAGKKVTVPGYLVKVSEESMISFIPKSTLASQDHPERAKIKVQVHDGK
jgi:small subunit ribosomal protein S4